MTVILRRLGVLFLALAVLMPLLQKSRAVPRREQAAFLRYTAGSCLVKVAGTGQRDGVYRFYDGVSLTVVNKMTGLPSTVGSGVREDTERHLKNGDMVVVGAASGNNAEISVKNMTIAERISLGIPLDPDTMTVADWEALPGIGPSLAKTIVADRQKNGAFHGLEGVIRVPGFGQGKLKSLHVFFK